MAFEFPLPDVGEGLTEATIVRWLVDVGDTVGLDQPIVEIETDKAVVEMPAPRAGVILYRGAPEGAVLAVDDLLVVIGEAGEEWEPGRPAPAQRAEPALPIVGTLDDAADVLGPAGAPQALPRVRKLAADLGVDLAAVTATGTGGRVTEDDVRAAAAAGDADVEQVPLSPTRRAIAAAMERSWREIPHVTTYGEADAGPLLAARRELAARVGSPVPLEALLITAIVPVLRRFPEFNATLSGDTLLLRRRYDVGFAVDTPDGLLVAVVRGAGDLDPAGLAAEISRLAEAARARVLAPDELRGATFTVSNIGAVGGRYGTPLIPHGTTAILSVGRAEPRPVARSGEVAIATEFPLSLSYDHRVIDGALGRSFLGAVAEAIESGGRA